MNEDEPKAKKTTFKLYASHQVGWMKKQGVKMVSVECQIVEQSRIRKDPLAPLEVHSFVLPPESAEELVVPVKQSAL